MWRLFTFNARFYIIVVLLRVLAFTKFVSMERLKSASVMESESTMTLRFFNHFAFLKAGNAASMLLSCFCITYHALGFGFAVFLLPLNVTLEASWPCFAPTSSAGYPEQCAVCHLLQCLQAAWRVFPFVLSCAFLPLLLFDWLEQRNDRACASYRCYHLTCRHPWYAIS